MAVDPSQLKLQQPLARAGLRPRGISHQPPSRRAHLPPRREEYPAGLARPPSTGGSGDVDCAQSINLPISPTCK